MRLFQPSILLLALAMTAPGMRAQAPQEPAPRGAAPPARDGSPRLGSGTQSYQWVAGAFAPPAGTEWGNTHGEIVVDRQGLLHISFDTAPAIRTFRADGSFVSGWGDEFADGVHGMTLACHSLDGKVVLCASPAPGADTIESLYFVHTGRHEWFQATLDGTILMQRGAPLESGKYESADQFTPTSIAVAPGGEIFVADGYGRHWIHKYDAQGQWLASFGGPGAEVGQLNCPHGLCIDTRGAGTADAGTAADAGASAGAAGASGEAAATREPDAAGVAPTLLVADRENHRIQRFGLDGKPLGVIAQAPDLRRPCKLQLRGSDLVIPDLAGRVTILGADNRVLAQLGDNPDEAQRAEHGVPREQWVDGVFLAPHSAAWDADGNLYVMDWNRWGRLSKLARLPSP